MRRMAACAVIALVISSLAGVGAAGAATSEETFDLHVGDVFLASLDPDFGAPNVASASNGDTFEIDDLTGTFNRATKSATGTGTWTHRSGDSVLGSGTVTLTRTIAFQFYGCGVDGEGNTLPPDFCGGRVILRAHFVESTTGFTFDGTIEVNCQVGAPPPGTSEGVKVRAGGLNFNKHVAGFNLYVQT